MDFATFSQRLRRADFLDGLGISIGSEEVALAHVTKRLVRVALLHGRAYPIPPPSRPEERLAELTRAVAAFLAETGVEPAAVHVCLPRQELLLNRLVLPAAAAENLGQVVEYELERVIPLPRDEVYFDYQTRNSGGGEGGRLVVLLVCVPRRIARQYLDALEAAGVRPKALMGATAALGDYAAFCRGSLREPLGVVTRGGGSLELALFVDGQLVASHGFRPGAEPTEPELQALLARDLAEVFYATDAPVPLLSASANGDVTPGGGDLFSLAGEHVEQAEELVAAGDPALLPAVGAALGAVRESVVGINLLPQESRPGLHEGLFVPILLMVAIVVLALLYGGSVVIGDEMTKRALARQVEELQPQVKEIRAQEAEARRLQASIQTVAGGEERRMVQYLRELTERIPATAFLSNLRYRNERIEIDGYSTSASSALIPVLEGSPMFRDVKFTTPSTRDKENKERFSIVAELER